MRTRAADCLGKVTQFSPRVDPIVNDLCKGIESAVSPAVQESTVEALQVLLLTSPITHNQTLLARWFFATVGRVFFFLECEFVLQFVLIFGRLNVLI